MTFEAVIFDLDGTLIDTESIAIASGQAAFAQLGHAVEADLLHQLIGKDIHSGGLILRGLFPNLDMSALDAAWNAEARALQAKGIPLKPGVHELLDILDARGLPKAIATSSRRSGATNKLAITELDRHFDIVITVDDVTQAKPAAEPYLLAAEKLGVSPSRTLVFEDSETGAASGKAAGMTVVQVPDLLPTQGEHAHHVANTLLEGAQWAGLLNDETVGGA
jgi:HAD superfamily hydrolase (TIGR01509 family)